MGAMATSTSTDLFIGAFAPAQVLGTDTSSTSIAYKPTTLANDASYTVYWYAYPEQSFGFASESSVTLNTADTGSTSADYRLSWETRESSTAGGWRAGSYTSLSSSTV